MCDIILYWLYDNNLIENISKPEAHAIVILVEVIAQQNNDVTGDVELVSHHIQQETVGLLDVGTNFVVKRKVHVSLGQMARDEDWG